MLVVRVIKKFKSILSDKQRKKLSLLLVLMVIGGFLEMLSVSAILPFMEMIMHPDEIYDKWYVILINKYFPIDSTTHFFLICSFVLAGVYIFKNVFLTFEYALQYKYVYDSMFIMQKRLHSVFIKRPYEYHLQADSGEMVRLINTDTLQAFYMLNSILNLLTEVIVVIVLIVTLFVITPFVTVCMALVMGILLVVIAFVLKPILKKTGEKTSAASARLNKWLLQSIQGIKEVKVMNKEDYFSRQFSKSGLEFANMTRKFNTINIIPRFLIEGCCLGAFFVVVGLMIYNGVDLDQMIPVLSAVAVAALRLLPSVNRISTDIGNISYYEPMLDNVIKNNEDDSKKELVAENARNIKIFSEAEPDIEINLVNATYVYPGTEKKILDDASLKITPGTSVGLVGASGGGKSTTVDVILGLLKCSDGQVLINGKDVYEDVDRWHDQVGYIPQMIFMLDDTIRANVAFGIDEQDVDENAVWRAIRDASLERFVKSLPEGLDTKIGERGVRISGGQRQRIGIARALYLNPQVLIFDEATSALDNETEKEIMNAVYNLHGKKTMIIIAHRLSTITECDEVYRIEEGKFIKER